MACLRACRGLRGFSLEGSQGAKKSDFGSTEVHIYITYIYIYMYKCGLHGGVVFQGFSTAEVISESVPPPCGVLTCTTEGPVAGLQVLHHHRLHVRASRRPRSDVSERDFQPACVRIVFFRPLVPAGLSEEFVPSLKKENQHKKQKTKTQTSCHDSKYRFARTHSLAAHPQQ